MKEKEFEDVVFRYPELIEDGLTVNGRQVYLRGKYADLLFTDKHGQFVVIELKIGVIKREHVGQVIDYAGYFVTNDGPPVRVIVVANRVPDNFRKSMDYHGIEWREIGEKQIRDLLLAKNDAELLESINLDDNISMSPNSNQLKPPIITMTKLESRPKTNKNTIRGIGERVCMRLGLNGREMTLAEIMDETYKEYFSANAKYCVRESITPQDWCDNLLSGVGPKGRAQGRPFLHQIRPGVFILSEYLNTKN